MGGRKIDFAIISHSQYKSTYSYMQVRRNWGWGGKGP